MGRGAGDSISGADSVTMAGIMAVKVAVIPGTDVGIERAVAVGVAAGWVGALPARAVSVPDKDADWARPVSRLDVNPVKATYSPNIRTRRTMRKPKAYPLLIDLMAPSMDSTDRCSDISARIILEKRADGKQPRSEG